ncbi:MAG: AAA family ATPase, partial [Thermoleophilaceae bacterium]
MTERPGSPPLLEREPELEAIEQAMAAAERAEGALVVIEGEAGIGKSSLLEHAATRARSRGMRALSARGSELEREFPLGVVLQLLSEPLESAGSRERRALLEGPAALASPLLEAREPADLPSAADSIFPLLHGLHWLVAALCERRPLLISVDDAQWADAASLTFLN